MSLFIHLHVHSAYSLSEGAIHVGALKDLCLASAMPAVAVTDTNNLFAALEASETLSGAGVQSITGIQLAVAPAGCGLPDKRGARAPSLVLLAQNETGYAQLMKLGSQAFLKPASEEAICVPLDEVLTETDGLICLTGGPDGPVDRLIADGREDDARQLLKRMKSAFGDRLYVELQRHGTQTERRVEPGLVEAAYALDLPLVATNEPYFKTAADHEAHDALLCIAEGAYVFQEGRRQVTDQHYFKTSEEMTALFADLPEAIENTVEIARRCAFRPRMHPPILPNFVEVADGADAAEVIAGEAKELERQAREGLKMRLETSGAQVPEDDYWKRLEHELTIINKMGFPGYFLIVADFIKWGKAHGIPVGPGRGSGAGSLVAWSLTITDLDPLRFGLLFERFLNPERVSMPDFDVDFCQDRRDEVIRYTQEKYGRDRVAQIITFGKLQARAVVRDVGRVLQMPFGQVDRLCKMIPNNPANPVTLDEAIRTEPRLREERDREEQVAELLEKALRLEGLYRHASTHAAGVVIGDRPLDELVPLYQDPRSDMPATQFNMKWVEPAGLVKFDFLGLKTLTVLARAVALIEKEGGSIDIDQLPLNDPPTYELLGTGASVGVFQLESAGMRATLRAMKPDTLEDIIALVSLYRPGPMDNIPSYIARKKGEEEPDYLHPTLEPVLKETFGVIIYQEQVMQIAQILAGYSLGEADLLRRAMGKKKVEEMERQKVRFVAGAEEKDVPRAKSEAIFELVAKFAGYGFNKSHAAAYAYIAFQTAYLKAHHAPAFLAASMSLDIANTDKLAVFLKEARRMEVPVAPPNVNRSEADFTVEKGEILYALAGVKNVGEEAMKAIVQDRVANGPFADLFDFAERVNLRLVGKRAIEMLARAGALDALEPSRDVAFASADLLVKYSAHVHEEKESPQGGLFGGGAVEIDRPRLAKPEERWTPVARLDFERAALGFYFSGHPLDEFEDALLSRGVVDHAEAMARGRGRKVAVTTAGVVRSVRRRRSKSGKPFAWVELSDQAGEYEATAFSEVLSASEALLEPGALVIAMLTAEDRDGEVRLTLESLLDLRKAAERGASRLEVALESEAALPGVLERIARAAAPAADRDAPTETLHLHLLLEDLGREVRLAAPAGARPSTDLRMMVSAVEGVIDARLA